MGMQVILAPNAQVSALFQGPRHEINVQLPAPENITVTFIEQINQVALMAVTPRIDVALVAGIPSAPQQGISGFTPADISAASSTHLYFGYDQTDWLIRRILRSGAGREIATVANNSAVLSFAAAWAARLTLNYQVLP